MSQKPNDQLLESLSALLDDEASELEVRRILKNVDHNPEMLSCWQRYNLIGSLMRKETLGDELGEPGFTALVAAAIRDEPEMAVEKSSLSTGSQPAGEYASSDRQRRFSERSSHWTWFGKASIAASFAAAVVFGANFMSTPSELGASGAPQMAGAGTEPGRHQRVDVPQGFQLPTLEARTVSQSSNPTRAFDSARRVTPALPGADDLTDGATQDMLNDMLIFHVERASANGGLGMMPFARVSKMNSTR